MKILIDKYIPYLQGIVDHLADVSFLEPGQFTPEAVKDADALIIRTRTRCNPDLLKGSRVQFIATATIGTDHIDLEYCRAHNIRVVSCPGCNAKAVCDYVEEALNEMLRLVYHEQPLDLSQPLPGYARLSLGVVGVGHVGRKVARMAMDKGFHVVVNDPPLSFNGDLSRCDVITFHTPLTRKGDYPTYHLCDAKFLSRCKPGAFIINSARGGVVDEHALLESGHPFVIDTWEAEPNINRKVLNRAFLASYHIAGYSELGKLNASRTCLSELSKHFNLPKRVIHHSVLTGQGDTDPGWLKRISDQLKATPANFEQLREQYVLR